jgi:transcriptional regulator with XRE-family HTH domain
LKGWIILADKKNNFGENLIKLRTLRGMRANELAKLLDVTASAVSAWEKGKREPSFETLKEIGSIFNVSIDTLLSHEIFESDKQQEEVISQMAQELYKRTKNNPAFIKEVLEYADYLSYKKNNKEEKEERKKE